MERLARERIVKKLSEKWNLLLIVLAGAVLLTLLVVMVGARSSDARKKTQADADGHEVNGEQTAMPLSQSQAEPVCVHASDPAPVAARIETAPDQAAGKKDDFLVDYEVLRTREVARKQMLEELRQKLKNDPDSGSTLSEEQIKRLEQSGDTFL